MTAREMALKAIAASRKSGAWADIFLDNLIKKEEPDPRDAALATKICYGVLQNASLCDFYISAYSTSVKPDKMEPLVADILRLSVYQILFLTKIPESAAVNEGVSLAKKYSNPGAAGLVNAVLRKITQNKNSLPEISASDFAKYLSIKYSHPEWLVRQYLGEIGERECEEMLRLNNTQPLTDIQINTLKTNTQNVLEELENAGVNARMHPFLDDCLELTSPGDVTALRPFAEGRCYIQDAAARLAVIAASPKPDMFIIDGCAAPGGKSFSAAIAMQDRGTILSCDLHEKKLRLIENGAKRLGIDIIGTRCLDGRSEAPELLQKADLVIADVPCSGLGVIGKKPDIRMKSESEISGLPAVQYDILQNLSKYVKPGGVLLYSTCTVLKRENEDVTDRFVSENPDFEYINFILPGIGDTAGKITLWPQRQGTDGFYISKLRRRG